MNPKLIVFLVVGGTLLWGVICSQLFSCVAQQEYVPVTPIPYEWEHNGTPYPIQTNPSMCSGCHYTLPIGEL